MNIFISGTDTDIGKTFITAGLSVVMQSLSYNTAVFKPFQSGAIIKNNFLISPYLSFIKKYDPFIETLYSYILKTPSSPQLACELENVEVNLDKILNDFNSLKSKCDITVTEGAGGLMVPLAKNMLTADLIKALDLPTIFVIRPNLGTINHTLLTLSYAKSKGINIRGIIINNYPVENDDIIIKTAPRLIKEYFDVEFLGTIPHCDKLPNASQLIDIFINNVDFEKVFDIKIPKLVKN